MQPNYYGMWAALKEAIKRLTVEGEMIHVSDLENATDTIESDESK